MIATRTPAIEAEDLAQVPAQILDVVADAADAELAEVREVLADLRRVEMELLGERLRRHSPHAGALERGQAAQVDREAVGRQLRDRLGALSRARLTDFVRPCSQAGDCNRGPPARPAHRTSIC